MHYYVSRKHLFLPLQCKLRQICKVEQPVFLAQVLYKSNLYKTVSSEVESDTI